MKPLQSMLAAGQGSVSEKTAMGTANDTGVLSPDSFSPGEITLASSITMAGGIVSQGFKFLVVIYVARRFSTVEFGWFSFAVAVNAYITVISNFGLPIFGSRSISKSGKVSPELLQEIVCLRLLLGAAAILVSLSVLMMLPQVGRTELALVFLFGVSNLPAAALVDWVFQGLHRQHISAFLNVVWQAGWLAFTVTGIACGISIVSVAIALSVSAALAVVIGFGCLRASQTMQFEMDTRVSLLKRIWSTLKTAMPLGWGTMVISVMVWTDAICVRLLRGEFAVAIYAAGNRAALALSMLGTFYVQGAFPLLSRSSDYSATLFEKCFTQTFSDLAMLFVPGSLWAIWYANEIITLIFRRSDFVAAVPVFRIFQVTLLFFVADTLLGTGVLIAFHRDRMFRAVFVGCAALFLLLCPLLTWKWGNEGAAVAVLLSQLFAFAWFVRETRAFVQVRFRDVLIRPFVVGAVCVMSCVALHLSLPLSLIPLASAYLVLLRLRSSQYGDVHA